jgi:diacylglycerol kinase (ATP)
MARRLKFIVNPEAGRGKSRNLDKRIQGILRDGNVEYSVSRTERAGEAIELARTSSKEYDIVVAVGGDGTANEVANGVIGSRATLGVIPSGSGNDFGKLLRMDGKIENSVRQIVRGKTEVIDSGTIRLEDHSQAKSARKFVNSIGIGFDAVVAYESQQIKRLKGIPLYLLAIFRSLQRLKPHLFEVSHDGKMDLEHFYLLCVGNGNCEGGGFRVTPGASPFDGIFQVCTVKQMSLLRALRILPTILKGEHGRFSEVDFFNTKRLNVGSRKPFVVHCDGEILGTQNASVEVEVHPKSLEVVVGS